MSKITLLAWTLLLSLFFLSGCSRVSEEDVRTAKQEVRKGALLLDVRRADEFSQGHLSGAVNIPVDQLPQHLSALSKKTYKTAVVYCRSGNRSAKAADILRKNGWRVIDVATQQNWNRYD
jgi:phage shock protein E